MITKDSAEVSLDSAQLSPGQVMQRVAPRHEEIKFEVQMKLPRHPTRVKRKKLVLKNFADN
jgi:hypothetical protein